MDSGINIRKEKLFGINGFKDSAEGVLARCSIGEINPFSRPCFIGITELFHKIIPRDSANNIGVSDEYDASKMM